LAQNLSGDLKDILIFHCDDKWSVLGVSGGPTLKEARERAERAYEGITAKWIETGISETEAAQWIQENTPDMSCSFCGKNPRDFSIMIESASGEVRVCNFCITEHYDALKEQQGDQNA